MDGNERVALVAEAEAVGMIVGPADGSIPEEDLASCIRSRLIPWVD
ncbi:MAG: hypothetical protein AMXMBFR53_30990 [Gemmatimonadota bacterium]